MHYYGLGTYLPGKQLCRGPGGLRVETMLNMKKQCVLAAMVFWVALGRVLPAGQRRQSLPFTQCQ